MATALNNSIFSIPFRFLWNTRFSSDSIRKIAPRTSLDRFIGDQNNRILQFLTHPAEELNFDSGQPPWPIVLFGKPGTGKTSLALTILSNVIDGFSTPTGAGLEGSARKPFVLNALEFDQRFRAAMTADSVPDFRRRILEAPGLLIDDVQKLESKPAAQRELMQLLDQGRVSDLPVVLTIDQQPQQCAGLISPLASRLGGGLCLPVRQPGPEARKVILRDLCQVHRLEFTEPALQAMVDRLNVPVPRMMQVFHDLLTRRRAAGDKPNEKIDVAWLDQMFQRSGVDQEQAAKMIVKATARQFQVKVSDLRGSSRKQSIAQARAVSIYLVRSLLGFSYSRIGTRFGNRDHSTIMHACKKIESLVDSDGADDDQVQNLKIKIDTLQQELANQLATQSNLENLLNHG